MPFCAFFYTHNVPAMNQNCVQKKMNEIQKLLFQRHAVTSFLAFLLPLVALHLQVLELLLITHSVVNSIPDTEAVFSKATLVTLVGSIIPASSIFTYSSVLAL